MENAKHVLHTKQNKRMAKPAKNLLANRIKRCSKQAYVKIVQIMKWPLLILPNVF